MVLCSHLKRKRVFPLETVGEDRAMETGGHNDGDETTGARFRKEVK